MDRYRLELVTYEGGGGDTRPFLFHLKTDLPPGFYDALWSALNAPPPPTSPESGRQKEDRSSCLLDYGVPVFTDDVASSNYPVFKGPATL